MLKVALECPKLLFDELVLYRRQVKPVELQQLAPGVNFACLLVRNACQGHDYPHKVLLPELLHQLFEPLPFLYLRPEAALNEAHPVVEVRAALFQL